MAKARAKITDELKELILADFHTGNYTQRELAYKFEISNGAVAKITKGLIPKNKELVSDAITLELSLSGLSEQEYKSAHKVIREKVKAAQLFEISAVTNQLLSNKILINSKKNKELGFADLESHSRITQRNKETVLGKSPDTIINNTNAQQTNITLDDFYDTHESDE